MEKARLRKIFRKTDGNCHICHRKLCFSNYGLIGSKGSWNIEHSVPRVSGGSDHMNNLFPACISCNSGKGTMHTKTARMKFGNTRAPFSRVKKEQIKKENTITGTIIGGAIGSLLGPAGVVICAGIGALVGENNSPKK